MQTIKIDFDNPGLPQRLDVVENDAQSRFFKAVLYKDGKAYTAPSGATYSIMYRGFGPQNEGWYDTIYDGAGKRAACSVSGNVVTCEIARQALRVPGHVSVVLCVTGSNGYMLHGWPIDCNCRNDSYTIGTSVESFFYITQVTNADWTSAIRTWEELKNMIDPTLSLSGKAADAKATGDAIGELKEDLGNIGKYICGLDKNNIGYKFNVNKESKWKTGNTEYSLTCTDFEEVEAITCKTGCRVEAHFTTDDGVSDYYVIIGRRNYVLNLKQEGKTFTKINVFAVNESETVLTSALEPSFATENVFLLCNKKEYSLKYYASWESGELNDNTGEAIPSTNNKSIRTINMISGEDITKISIPTGFRVFAYLYDKEKNYLKYDEVFESYRFMKQLFYRIVLSRTDAFLVSCSDVDSFIFNETKNDTSKWQKYATFPTKSADGYYNCLQESTADFGKDTSSDQYYTKLDEVVTSSNGYIEKELLGYDSSGKYPLYKLTLNPINYSFNEMVKADIPKIIIISGQHGYEKSSQYGLYYWLKDLVENWDKNTLLEYVKCNCKIVIVPIANPWAFDRNLYLNSNEVNLNRNWGYNWSGYDYEYKGNSAMSENETKLIAKVIEDNKDAIFLCDYHCNGNASLTEKQGNIANWHSYTRTDDVICDSLAYASKNFIDLISNHFIKDYNLPMGTVCGIMDTSEKIYPVGGIPCLQDYGTDNGIPSITFEGFNGFVGRDAFTEESAKANAELIGNWIPTVLMHYKKYFDVSL